MPHWVIFHSEGVLESKEAKQALAKDITSFYVNQVELPAFYVVVNFVRATQDDFFIGGESRDLTGRPFVRLTIAHIAVNVPDQDEAYQRVTSGIDQILNPHFEKHGVDWEYHITQDERRLWKTNGLIPPVHGSAEEKLWAKHNRVVEYDGGRV